MTKKQLTYIIATGVLIVILALAYFLGYAPIAQQVQAKQVELTQKQQQLDTVKKKVQELAKLRSEIEEIQKETQALQEKIPSQTDVPGIITLLEQLAEENGLIVASVKFDGNQSNTQGTMSSPVSDININTCSMSFKGKYASVISYFTKMRESPRLFGIKNIQFSPSNEVGNEITIGISLAYFNYSSSSVSSAPAPKKSAQTN